MRLRTILTLTLCALPTAAALVLLSSRRAARDREEDALDEVARLQLRIVEAMANLDVASSVVRKCHAERNLFADDALAVRETLLVSETELAQVTRQRDEAYRMHHHEAARSHARHVERDEAVDQRDAAIADAAQARAAEQAAYERAAAVGRGHAMQVGQAEATLAQVRSDLNRAIETMGSNGVSLHDAAACVVAAEKARDEAVARVAKLERDAATWDLPVGFRWEVVPVRVHVEPAAGAPAASCAYCDRSMPGKWFGVDNDPGPPIRICYYCNQDNTISSRAIRTRHAARTASATPVAAVEPCSSCDTVGNCPACNPPPGEEDADEKTSVLESFLTDLGDMLESHLPAPTQDDLDDAAVRLKLADGPMHWMSIVNGWTYVQGDVLDRFLASQKRLQLVLAPSPDVELWALPAAAAKDPS